MLPFLLFPLYNFFIITPTCHSDVFHRCLVEGEADPFEVIVNVVQNICQLKKFIQGEKAALRSVDASGIALWKVSTF